MELENLICHLSSGWISALGEVGKSWDRCGDEDRRGPNRNHNEINMPFFKIQYIFINPRLLLGLSDPGESMGLIGHLGTVSPIHLTDIDRAKWK